MAKSLDTPRRKGVFSLPEPRARDTDRFGAIAEGIARFMGTARFIVWLTVFCVIWLVWNTVGPENARFDSAALGFTALTLILSLQASYAAPLILLAQNRQTDRDRVAFEQDRQRAERNLADTEYLAREMAALRVALAEVATRDFVRAEIRNLLESLEERDERSEEVLADFDARDAADDAAAADRREAESRHQRRSNPEA